MARGWIEEDDFRFASVSLTAGTEASDDIPVTVQLQDQNGDAFESAVTFLAEVLDANAELHAATAFTMDETGSGTAVSAADRPAFIFTTSSLGAAQLTVTDVATGSGLTVSLVLTPLNVRGPITRTTLTFD
jgi:uncharacterized protein YqjF (DUF2071 family)